MRKTLALVVLATFLPFLWKGVEYATIGSYVPLAVFGVCAGLVVSGAVHGGRWLRTSVKTWAVCMVAWGVARLTMMLAIWATGLDEAHLMGMVSAVFAAVSGVYIAAGVFVWRASRQLVADPG